MLSFLTLLIGFFHSVGLFLLASWDQYETLLFSFSVTTGQSGVSWKREGSSSRDVFSSNTFRFNCFLMCSRRKTVETKCKKRTKKKRDSYWVSECDHFKLDWKFSLLSDVDSWWTVRKPVFLPWDRTRQLPLLPSILSSRWAKLTNCPFYLLVYHTHRHTHASGLILVI